MNIYLENLCIVLSYALNVHKKRTTLKKNWKLRSLYFVFFYILNNETVLLSHYLYVKLVYMPLTTEKRSKGRVSKKNSVKKYTRLMRHKSFI